VADEPLTRNELLLRETSKLFGMLFIGRRDAKAVFRNGEWCAIRKKYSLDDFRRHLFDDRCLGAYLLDADSMVRCVAFDVDLKDDADYFLIGDDSSVREDEPPVDGELDLQIQHHGNLEEALHNPHNPAHRWACSLVRSTVHYIEREVWEALSLTCTIIITGGGAHVFVPFGHLVPASEARAMAHSVMDGIPMFARRSESFYQNHQGNPSVEIEVFPKQDALKDPESLGNLIRLPFGMHERGMRTYALNPVLPQIPNWGLRKLSSMDALRLQANTLDLKWDCLVP
jgi:hypothetical protein